MWEVEMKVGWAHSLKSAVIIFFSLDLRLFEGENVYGSRGKHFDYAVSAVLGEKLSVGEHLELGKKFLQDGQFSDALHHYSAACGELTCPLLSCQ